MKQRALIPAILISLSLTVACDDENGLGPACEDTFASGKADGLGEAPDVVDEMTVLTRETESGLPQVTILEGLDALAFDALVAHPDFTDDDLDAFLEVREANAEGGSPIELGDESAEHREPGVCIPIVNRHVRTMHVGWDDTALAKRAPSLPTGQAGSWSTTGLAFQAISALLELQCTSIMQWERTAIVGDHIRRRAHTGVPGRACFWNAECLDVWAAELIWKKTAQGHGWHAGKIVTAYPVPF